MFIHKKSTNTEGALPYRLHYNADTERVNFPPTEGILHFGEI